MRISIYHNLKSRRSYSASTGLTPSEFDELAKDFCQLYQVAEHKFPENFGRPTAFSDGRELLFLLLYYKKMYPTFDVLALNFGISNATAHLYIQIAKALLKTVLAKRKLLPKRVFKDEQEFEKFFQNIDELFIDATERPIQRPSNQQEQEESYSVKKTMCFQEHGSYFKNTVYPFSRYHRFSRQDDRFYVVKERLTYSFIL